jgi:peptide-methionine (S)-S-oxide reductase
MPMKPVIAAALALAAGLTFATAAKAQETAEAILAGGCFWCVEADMDKVPGVSETVSGYIGGWTENPTYQSHSSDGHYEAVLVTFDPAVTSYRELLDIFWRTVDVVDDGGQFCDRGPSYRTAIFVASDEERAEAEASKAAAEAALGRTIVTPILDATAFWPAEDYHQDYYLVSSFRYTGYRFACGRDRRVKQLWGDAAYQGLAKD